MNWQEAIKFTQMLSKINTYETQGKRECILLIEKILNTRTNAITTVYDLDTDAPYIISKLFSNTKHTTASNSSYKLLLEGHIDVVAPGKMEKPFEAEIVDGVMYGRGVADMKGGCGAILKAFIETANKENENNKNLTGDLYLMFSSDEEYAGENIKKALDLEQLPKIDFALIPEPSDGKICNAHKGEVWLQVEFFGKNAHSSTPKLGNNAIYMAMDFIQKLRILEKEYEKNIHPAYGCETVSVGVIEGGENPNMVPAYSKILIDQRYLPEQDVEKVTEDFSEIIRQCREENSDFQCKFTVLGNWNSMYTDETSKDFKRIKDTFSKEYGKELELVFWQAWGEGGYINMYDIPTAYFGAGDIKFAHSPNEQINICEIAKLAKGYYDVVRELCGANEK